MGEIKAPRAVLGIDAAWTDKQPSGVALLEQDGARWKCLRVAPSYAAFCNGFRWEDPVCGGEPDVARLLEACASLSGGGQPSIVAADIPLSFDPITERRVADNSVSRRFGARKCAAHSPSAIRPGKIGERLQRGFRDAGFPLVVDKVGKTPALLEVYPHVALLGLTGATERLPYKVSRSGAYWGKSAGVTDRKGKLLEEWRRILAALSYNIDGIGIDLPSELDRMPFQYLKRYEDAIDALVCTWMAARYLVGDAEPLGDESAAIWVPKRL